MFKLQREDNFFTSFLSSWVLTQQASPLYQDTKVYCKDEMMQTNRLVLGLIFPQLGCWEGFSLPTTVEVILPDWERRDVEDRIGRVLGGRDGVKKEGDTASFDFNEDINCANYIGNIDGSEDVDNQEGELKIEKDDKAIAIGQKIDFPKIHVLEYQQSLTLKSEEQEETKENILGGKWTCNVCSMHFRFVEQLRKHSLDEHQKMKFLKCKYCDYETKINNGLKRHENIHTKEKLFHCDECDKIFLDLSDLKKHKTSHYDQEPVKCDQCDKTLKSIFRLKTHIRLMHDRIVIEDEVEGTPYMCEMCPSKFRTKVYLKVHKKKVHSGYLFMCSFCDRKCKTKVHLKEHEAIHEGRIKYTNCTVCGRRTKDCKRYIERHMKTHYNAHMYSVKCDKCEYYFRSQKYLIDHDRMTHLEL